MLNPHSTNVLPYADIFWANRGCTYRFLVTTRYNMAKFGDETFSGKTPDDLPLLDLGPLSDEIFSSYTGPDDGLCYVIKEREQNGNHILNGNTEIAGVSNWNSKDQKAYGICLSLYEQHPVNGKMSGDPVADAFALCARRNNCVLLIADGVNWGEKSRLAARCALYGSMNYINNQLFHEGNQPSNTQEAVTLLRNSFDAAHQTIISNDGGLTTMCACLLCPVKNSDQFAVCCVNVGDSFAYVFSHNHGIRELTIGSHDVHSERDIRDAGGALGPVNGKKPELQNLTCSLTFANPGDIVFLTTDGISDNFDPVVTKVALPCRPSDTDLSSMSTSPDHTIKPEMDPRERHHYSMKEMERIVHEFELVTEEQCSAQELCGAIVQHVLSLTDPKRKILENPALYVRRKMTSNERKTRDSEIVEQMARAPGKLDHASIVSCEIGVLKPDEEEMENIPLQDNNNGSDTLSIPSSSDTATSPSSPGPLSPSSKKSRPKKLFSKIRSLSVSSSQSSPNHNSSGLFPISPKRFSFRRSRSKSEAEPVSPLSPQNPNLSPRHSNMQSPTPMSPGSSPEFALPLPAQHPYRKSLSYESSV